MLAPVVLAAKATYPMPILLSAVVLEASVDCPIAILLSPVVFASKAPLPRALLLAPVVLAYKALVPRAVLLSPDVIACRVPTPTPILFSALLSVPVVVCPRSIELVKLVPPSLASLSPSMSVAPLPEPPASSAQDKAPEPLVVSTCPSLPSAPGRVKITLDETVEGETRAI